MHVELTQYLCYSSIQSTFVKGINKHHFKTWLDLSLKLIEIIVPNVTATIQGQLYQEKLSLQGTKKHIKTSNGNDKHLFDEF